MLDDLYRRIGLVPRADLTAYTDALDAALVRELAEIEDRLTAQMEARLMATEDELWERIATRTGIVMAELASLQDTIVAKDEALAAAQAALAGADADAAQKVADALALDAQLDAARLQAHLTALGDDVPVDVPVVSTPEAGEPADVPDDSGVDPIDEGSLPETSTPDPGNDTSTHDVTVTDGGTVEGGTLGNDGSVPQA